MQKANYMISYAWIRKGPHESHTNRALRNFGLARFSSDHSRGVSMEMTTVVAARTTLHMYKYSGIPSNLDD